MATRRRLSHLLLISHAGLVLLLALLLLFTGTGTIRKALIGQAHTQAEQAISDARRRLLEFRRELSLSASLLAEQPTLQLHLSQDQLGRAREVAADFQRTSGVDYLRIEMEGRVVTALGEAPTRWGEGLSFGRYGEAWRTVSASMPQIPQGRVWMARRVGDRLESRAGARFVEVSLHAPPLPDDTGDPRWLQALREAYSSGDPQRIEDDADSAAVRVVSLRDETGQAAGLLVARVARSWVQQRTMEWLTAFGLGAFGMLLVAIGVGAWLAARIAAPFSALARAAAGLGDGDLDTPVRRPTPALSESSALAHTLESMRQRLDGLTRSERRQREQLDAVLDGVDEGILGLDAEGHIRYANRQLLKLVGRDREAVIGLPWTQLLTPVSASAHAPVAALAPVVERCSTPGRPRTLVVRRQQAQGAHPSVLIVREETVLESARAVRDTILANLSHEFQTPLSAQMAAIELLRDHLQDSADPIARRLADAQYRGALRLSQLVDNLLDSVRIESGALRLRRQQVDLPLVVQEAVELLLPLIEQRDQRVELECPAGPLIPGDAQRLSSVVINLLANANKFAPDQTVIRVQLAWGAQTVCLWVRDQGPGLPTSDPHGDLLAPFRRAPESEPEQRGSGLGLAIVRAIAEAHGGVLRFGQEADAAGACIGVELPLQEAGCAS